MKLFVNITVLFNDGDVRSYNFKTLRSVREFFCFNGRSMKKYSFFFYHPQYTFRDQPFFVYRYRSASQSYSVIRQCYHVAKQLLILPY